MLNLDTYFSLTVVAAFLVGLSKGGLPSISMLAVPLLSLVMSPVKAAALLLPIFVISDWIGVYLYRRDFSEANLRLLIPAGIVGVLAGWLTASIVSDRVVTFLIGTMGVAFCVNVWVWKKVDSAPQPAHSAKGWFWGTLTGFTSFISHSGGPPFQIFMLPQKLAKAEFAGTATIVFAVINAAKIIPYQNLRPYSNETLLDAMVLIPFALIGTVTGTYITQKVSSIWFYRIVQISMFLVSIKLLADAAHS